MAKLKYEFLDHYFKANGLPLRNRIFGNIAKVNAWGSRFAPFSNWAARSPLGKLIASAMLGIHPQSTAARLRQRDIPSLVPVPARARRRCGRTRPFYSTTPT